MSLKKGKPQQIPTLTAWSLAIQMLMVRVDAFPSSEAFEAINGALSSSDAERKSAIKKGQAVFAFTLKNKAGETSDWHIDLKEKGTVGTGLGNNPSGTVFSRKLAALVMKWQLASFEQGRHWTS